MNHKLEAGEFDKLEKRAKQIDQYETRVHEKAAEVEAESQVGRVETKTERKIPTAAQSLSHYDSLSMRKKKVELESMVDDYIEKLFKEWSKVADIQPSDMPKNIFDETKMWCFS